jgi:hypothetical protein
MQKELRLTLISYQPINYQPRNYSTKTDCIAICHSSEDGCSATKMSQTLRGSAISNRTIGRCTHERWLQFLPVGTKIKNCKQLIKHQNTKTLNYSQKMHSVCWPLGLCKTTWAWFYQQKYPEKFSEFLSDFLFAKIANQYFWLSSYGTILKGISKHLIR